MAAWAAYSCLELQVDPGFLKGGGIFDSHARACSMDSRYAYAVRL